MVASRTSVTILLFAVVALCSLPSPMFAARPPKVSPPPPATATPVEYVLGIQWGFTVCNRNPRCRSIIIPEFTIHGLWMIGQPDTSVCKGDAFSADYLKGMEKTLNNYWIDAEYGINKNLWSHEYNYHGICDNSTVYSFFNKVINLYTTKVQKMNLLTRIRNLYGHSQLTVKEGTIYTGLKAGINKDFGMVCKHDDATNVYKLQELRIQFIQNGNQLTTVDLAQMPVAGRCPPGSDILLPFQ